MITWKGRGILVPVVFTALLLGITAIFAEPDTPFSTSWTLGPSLLLTGMFSFYFGNLWNKAPGKVYIDKASGQEVELKHSHSFFWIKMEHWGIICGVLGLVSLILGFV